MIDTINSLIKEINKFESLQEYDFENKKNISQLIDSLKKSLNFAYSLEYKYSQINNISKFKTPKL